MDIIKRTVRVISLRPEQTNDDSFENALRNSGHKVTVLSSTEPAFSLVNSSWPDVVMFDPISQFGMSGSIQRLRSSFDGLIIAAGHIPDPTITSMLEELGIVNFADSAANFRALVDNAPIRKTIVDIDPYKAVTSTPEPSEIVEVVSAADPGARQLLLTEPVNSHPAPTVPEPSKTVGFVDRSDPKRRSMPSIKLPSLRDFADKLPLKRWHRTMVGTAVATAVIAAVAIPFVLREQSVEPEQPVAKALPVIPNLLLKPLVPLSIAELSGEFLPLEIDGIEDRAVIEKAAIAFWGDTAPDAFVTVNGEPIVVSEYGAFVVDFPLDDGGNFVEVLASDFQGRTTRKSFTVVSLQ
jgi:hypothetical protein